MIFYLSLPDANICCAEEREQEFSKGAGAAPCTASAIHHKLGIAGTRFATFPRQVDNLILVIL